MLAKRALEVHRLVPGILYSTVSSQEDYWRMETGNRAFTLECFHHPKFRMETVAPVLASVWKEDLISIDLRETYFQIPVHLESRAYLRLMW